MTRHHLGRLAAGLLLAAHAMAAVADDAQEAICTKMVNSYVMGIEASGVPDAAVRIAKIQESRDLHGDCAVQMLLMPMPKSDSKPKPKADVKRSRTLS